jgi:hypothetical protein
MSCPYFYPVEACAGSAMLPLGGWWKGDCFAVPGAPQAQAGAANIHCNLGYARGACARFPEGEGPDAVRFTIARHESAAIRIYYVMEQDHYPFAHGRLDYSCAQAGLEAPAQTATLERQAEAYVESYLRHKEEY